MSLGARRDFLLRRNADKSEVLRFSLGKGDVLAMAGSVQDEWQHSVPRRRGSSVGERISLTFRRIVAHEAEVGGPAGA